MHTRIDLLDTERWNEEEHNKGQPKGAVGAMDNGSGVARTKLHDAGGERAETALTGAVCLCVGPV